MTKKQIEVEADFAQAVYKERARINRKAQAILTGTRPLTTRAIAKLSSESSAPEKRIHAKR